MTNPYSNKGLYKKRRVNLSAVPDSAESDSFLSVLDNDYFIVLAPFFDLQICSFRKNKRISTI